MLFLKKSLPILMLVILAGFLRFYNLGYSEFQDDEKKAFIRKKETTSTYEFLMEQRKGPMQFLVTSATLLIHDDPKNELLIRVPFTAANLASVLVFYFIVKELINSKLIAFLGAVIYSANGFIVGFSRIAQYQNLNLLFSLLSLYFFIRLAKSNSKYFLFSFLGTISISLSLLSHWDAIFFIPPVIYFYAKFLLREKVDKGSKIKVTISNILLGSLILLPFLIPYVKAQTLHEANTAYFDRRIGLSEYSLDKHKFIFELYNPYLTIYFLPLLAIFSLFAKKNLAYLVWFLVNLVLIRFLMEKPGTHIYNYVIPLLFMAVAGLEFLYNRTRFYIVRITFLLTAIGFIYYQSYIIFVDHTKEYPWEEKDIVSVKNLKLTTMPYNEKEVLTFGFPHFRNWKKINEIVSNDPDNCTYISNEGKEITEIYIDHKYGIHSSRTCYYIIDIKRPFITRGNDAIFAKARGKKPVYEYKRGSEELVRVYKIKTD